MSSIVASLVIEFNDPSSGDDGFSMTAELDSREEGYNAGNTQFVAGDSPAFLVYKSPEITINSIRTTIDLVGGSVLYQGSGIENIVEFLKFAEEARANLRRPPFGAVTLEYASGDVRTPSNRGGIVTLSASGLSVFKATYATQFLAYKLIGAPSSLLGELDFPVIVYIKGSST